MRPRVPERRAPGRPRRGIADSAARRLRASIRSTSSRSAHHGSADQSAALYETLRATVGLIGVGAGNDYGHPTDELLGILTAVGTTAERSDLDGLVLVAPTGRSGEVERLDRAIV